MRVITIRSDEQSNHTFLLDEMHRLRARVFSNRLGWEVSVRGGRERDQYDDLRPTYILVVSAEGRVAGSVRLLPAVGPTMLSETFPQLLHGGRLFARGGMVESSRFCVDTEIDSERGTGALKVSTLTLFAAIIEWSMANGYKEIVTATDTRFERILKRAGWPMSRLGEPQRIGNTMAVAGVLPANLTSFDQVRPANYVSDIAAPRRSAA